jgi:hypothetical protein
MKLRYTETDDDALNSAIDLLRCHGYQVLAPSTAPRWESPAHFCDRVGIAVSSLQRTLRRARSAGIAFDTRYHDSLARMRVIRSNPDLEAFIQHNRTVGSKSRRRPVFQSSIPDHQSSIR